MICTNFEIRDSELQIMSFLSLYTTLNVHNVKCNNILVLRSSKLTNKSLIIV